MPGKRREKEALILPALAVFLFALDRFSKLSVLNHFEESQSMPLIPNVFHFTRVNNTGAAFGLFRHSALFLVLFSVICSAFLSVYIFKNRQKGTRILLPAFLILTGALGNLVDRIQYGYVVDFLDFRFWPVFNIADSCITIGVLLMLWNIFYAPHSV